MNKTITQFLKLGFQNLRVFAVLLFGAVATLSYGQAYNETDGHGNGCSWTNGNFTYDRWGAIDAVAIEDAQGNVVYSKAADGCNAVGLANGTAATPGRHHTLIEPTSAFTLNAGSQYKIKVRTINPSPQNWNNSAGVWIDYNGDKDFVDANEFVKAFNNFAPGSEQEYGFTVPCNGTAGNVRMRVRAEGGATIPPNLNSGNHSNRFNYGETEDFEATYAVPSGLSADFLLPDSVFIGTQAVLTNANQSGYISHIWTVNGVTVNATNYQNVFNTAGSYDVKLVSENCLGKDSVTKTLRVVAPTAPPVANFVSTVNVIELFEPFQLYDLSTNGATFWDWIITNGTDTLDGDDEPALRGNLIGYNDNPTVNTGNYFGALDIGVWDVSLKTSNSIGSSPYFTKVGYITVRRTNFDLGAGTTEPITSSNGRIFDNGGELFDYPSFGGANNTVYTALISPCGAESVTLDFDTFAVAKDVTLRIYDGSDPNGIPLHPTGGFDENNVPSGPIVGNSGALYLFWEQRPNVGRDIGFAASWSSKQGPGNAPVADFELPDVDVYLAVPFELTNSSTDVNATSEYLWEINGPETVPGAISEDYSSDGITSTGTYTIRLTVTNCDGKSSSVTKTFDVLQPNTPTEIDFVANNRRPAVGGLVDFSALSDKANRWEWSFFPPTGVSEPVPGSIDESTRTFQFTSPGAYAVQLKGYNSLDSANSVASVVKTNFVLVVNNCIPIVPLLSADVGISKFSIEDITDASKNYSNSSDVGQDAYSNYADLGTFNVNYGGKYKFDIERNSTVNNITRRIWVDWNVDGDFDDPLELVAQDDTPNNDKVWSGIINIPNSVDAFDAITTLRIGVSLDNDPNLSCGAASNSAANRVGEFEDYAIRVVNDGNVPVITLKGADTVLVEQLAAGAAQTYVSDMATAFDESQGDITANVTMTTDLDQTLAGVYYELYNAMDASGNEAEEVQRVIYVVADQTAPEITLNGAADTTIEVGVVWQDPLATADDNKEGDLTSSLVTSGVVNADLLGDYTITYTISDNQGNTSQKTRIVRVVDTQVPVIENAAAAKPAGACWTVEVQLQNIFADITTATDNYNSLAQGLTLTANPASAQGGAAVDTRFQGTTTVTYTATDESGNVTTQCVDYVVRDYIAPEIELNTLPTIYHNVNSPYTPIPATASDNLYNSTQISLTSTSNVDPYTLGTYQDTYTATDAAGNTATKIRTVIVIDDEAPSIAGKDGGVLRLGVGSAYNAVNSIVFSDNYDAPEDLLANMKTIYNDINLQEAGTYSFVISTTDNSGNESNEYTLLIDVQYRYEQLVNSVNDVNLDNLLTVAPNPTTGKLNISVNLPENEEINIAIYNALGQEVVLVESASIASNNYTVNLENQTNGIYYVKMNVKGDIVTKKIILNK